MRALHDALVSVSLDRRIEVSTTHTSAILSVSSPPSQGRFKLGYDVHILEPLLKFLNQTVSPFMINPYPYLECKDNETINFALFWPNPGFFDKNTNLTYTTMLDGQIDAVFSAMARLGFPNIEIVISETGWPSKGDEGLVGLDAEKAAECNSKVMKHVSSGVGTPLLPNRTFETYIFALFNEDLTPGPTCERNFGLFEPDFTPIYDIGIMKSVVLRVSGAIRAQHNTWFITVSLLIVLHLRISC